ncbi:hypothetical protein AACH10_14515 [Ideonella sp. DXS22W]|uniref:DUF2147 domain-containing protein n=1 Tax=Pseudaquabacterium inlustre TaxID=2984192 RepID=A0ABU9CHY7_9BURK
MMNSFARKGPASHGVLLAMCLMSAASIAETKPWANWLIRREAGDGWSVEITNDSRTGSGHWRLLDAASTEVARLAAPPLPKGHDLNLGQCKINGQLRDDVIAIVQHRKGVEWSRSVAKAWIADPKARAFSPTPTQAITCRNEGVGL